MFSFLLQLYFDSGRIKIMYHNKTQPINCEYN